VGVRFIDRTLVGEACVGGGPEIAHIELVVGPRGSPVELAFVQGLAHPTRGHTPLLALIAPNLMAKPATLMVPKATIRHRRQLSLFFGAAQAGVARAVAHTVASGLIDAGQAEDVFIIASCVVLPEASDEDLVFSWNYEATRTALGRALRGEPSVYQVLEEEDRVVHPEYPRSGATGSGKRG
jgi:5,6,7,8-tetrahydromethanopterin hydro-lyase